MHLSWKNQLHHALQKLPRSLSHSGLTPASFLQGNYNILRFFTQPMPQCTLEAILELLFILRCYSKRLFRQQFKLLRYRQSRALSRVSGNKLHKPFSCLKMKFLFHWYFLKFETNLYDLYHSASSQPLVKDLLEANSSGCPVPVHRSALSPREITHTLRAEQKAQPSLKHVVQISDSTKVTVRILAAISKYI